MFRYTEITTREMGLFSLIRRPFQEPEVLQIRLFTGVRRWALTTLR